FYYSALRLFISSLFFSSHGHPPDLHSFPTRRSSDLGGGGGELPPADGEDGSEGGLGPEGQLPAEGLCGGDCVARQRGQGVSRAVDRKSTRLNSSHDQISYAVFCLKKKKKKKESLRYA